MIKMAQYGFSVACSQNTDILLFTLWHIVIYRHSNVALMKFMNVWWPLTVQRNLHCPQSHPSGGWFLTFSSLPAGAGRLCVTLVYPGSDHALSHAQTLLWCLLRAQRWKDRELLGSHGFAQGTVWQVKLRARSADLNQCRGFYFKPYAYNQCF